MSFVSSFSLFTTESRIILYGRAKQHQHFCTSSAGEARNFTRDSPIPFPGATSRSTFSSESASSKSSAPRELIRGEGAAALNRELNDLSNKRRFATTQPSDAATSGSSNNTQASTANLPSGVVRCLTLATICCFIRDAPAIDRPERKASTNRGSLFLPLSLYFALFLLFPAFSRLRVARRAAMPPPRHAGEH